MQKVAARNAQRVGADNDGHHGRRRKEWNYLLSTAPYGYCLTQSRLEKQYPSPCSRHEYSIGCGSRRKDRTSVRPFFESASPKRRSASLSVAPKQGKIPTGPGCRAFQPAARCSRYIISPQLAPPTPITLPGCHRIIGNTSRPESFTPSSHSGEGWVAPAFTNIASVGPGSSLLASPAISPRGKIVADSSEPFRQVVGRTRLQ
jgi:hypothetical protein